MARVMAQPLSACHINSWQMQKMDLDYTTSPNEENVILKRFVSRSALIASA